MPFNLLHIYVNKIPTMTRGSWHKFLPQQRNHLQLISSGKNRNQNQKQNKQQQQQQQQNTISFLQRSDTGCIAAFQGHITDFIFYFVWFCCCCFVTDFSLLIFLVCLLWFSFLCWFASYCFLSCVWETERKINVK